MNKITNFPNQKKEQIYKFDTCAGCHKDMEKGEKFTKVTLPYMKKVEYIALCAGCADVSRQHGVNV